MSDPWAKVGDVVLHRNSDVHLWRVARRYLKDAQGVCYDLISTDGLQTWRRAPATECRLIPRAPSSKDRP